MKHYAGLDVSVKETSLCIVDETGRICREARLVSHPDDLLAALNDPIWRFDRIGLEAGPLSQGLFSGLAEAGLPVICIETRHAKAFLKAQVNKSDQSRRLRVQSRVDALTGCAADLFTRPCRPGGEASKGGSSTGVLHRAARLRRMLNTKLARPIRESAALGPD